MNTITILAMLAILSGVSTLSISGFAVMNAVVAQMADNPTIGNMTGGTATGGNMSETSGSISSLDSTNDGESGDISNDDESGCIDC
jgi:hypothetical protein